MAADPLDRNAIAAALLGPLFYRRRFAREQIDAEFVEIIIGSALAGLHQSPNKHLVQLALDRQRTIREQML